MPTDDEVLAAHERHTRNLLSLPGVHAVGVGLRMRGGELTDERVIVCFVERKRPRGEISDADAIPEMVDGVATDVQESERFDAYTSDPTELRAPIRPLIGGLQLQIDNHYGTLGFLGSVGGILAAVSNAHVMAPTGSTIYQPTNAKHQDVGTTTVSVLSADVDGAFMLCLQTAGLPVIAKWGGTNYAPIPVTGAYTVTLGDLPYPVWKTGRTTGTTTGNVTALGVSGTRTDGWNFTNQLAVTPDGGAPFGSAGDSGSAIVDGQNRVVALYWGGSPARGLGSPIAAVQAQLGIQVAVFTGANTPKQLTAVPSFDELLDRLAGLGPHGERIAMFLRTHGPQVHDLIHTDHRVALVWQRQQGHQICNELIANLATASTPMPATMAGAPTRHAFEAFAAVLEARGGGDLCAALRDVREHFEWFLDRSYEDCSA